MHGEIGQTGGEGGHLGEESRSEAEGKGDPPPPSTSFQLPKFCHFPSQLTSAPTHAQPESRDPFITIQKRPLLLHLISTTTFYGGEPLNPESAPLRSQKGTLQTLA